MKAHNVDGAVSNRGPLIATIILTVLLCCSLVAVIVLAVRLAHYDCHCPYPGPTVPPTPYRPTLPYYGLDVGPLSQLDHSVSGKVYVVDARRIRVRDLTYDGTAPQAFFWIGQKGKANAYPDQSGESTPDERGSETRITRAYNKEDIILTLKSNLTVSDLRWFSMWCVQYTMNFGHVDFPMNLYVPKPTMIGQFSAPELGIQSGPITVLDHKTVFIERFSFDGRLNDIYFGAGNGTGSRAADTFVRIPRAEGGLAPLSAITAGNVTLNFPEGLTLFDIDFVTVYSAQTPLGNGLVPVSKSLNVPPHIAPPN